MNSELLIENIPIHIWETDGKLNVDYVLSMWGKKRSSILHESIDYFRCCNLVASSDYDTIGFWQYDKWTFMCDKFSFGFDELDSESKELFIELQMCS